MRNKLILLSSTIIIFLMSGCGFKVVNQSELIDFYIDHNSDQIENYKKVCEEYNVELTIRSRAQNGINRKNSMEQNLPKMLESQYRIYQTCLKTNSEWVMTLEDDVLIKRKIKNWPNSDCGINREYLKVGGGGCIIKKDKYIKMYEYFEGEKLINLIKSNHTYSWAGDELKGRMWSECGFSYEKWIELAEPEYYDNTDHAVFHGYKDLYNI